MEGIKIIVICLIAYNIVLTIVCAKLFSTISEGKFKSEIDRIKIGYLEKCCDINKESINLLTKSLKDLNGIVKKYVIGNEDDTDTKPDVDALIAGWNVDDKVDDQEEQKLFHVDEVRYKNIAEACNSSMLLQSTLLAQGLMQQQYIMNSQQLAAIMPPMWNATGNISRRLGDYYEQW